MSTQLKHNKPVEIEILFPVNRVKLRNVDYALVCDYIRTIEAYREYILKYNNIPFESIKDGYLIFFEVLGKLKRATPYIRSLTLTIPQAIAIYTEFSKETYIGTYINYTASLIHQKLS